MAIKIERIKEVLKEEYYEDLLKFMAGQTVSEDGIYEDDFLRWLKKLPVVD